MRLLATLWWLSHLLDVFKLVLPAQDSMLNTLVLAVRIVTQLWPDLRTEIVHQSLVFRFGPDVDRNRLGFSQPWLRMLSLYVIRTWGTTTMHFSERELLAPELSAD